MSLSSYIPVLIQLTIAIGLGVLILAISHLLGQRAATNKIKDSAYECGIPGTGGAHPQFAVKFYVTAMLFIIFDIEVVFLIPWVLTYRDLIASNISIIIPILFFLTVLVVGLFYEIKKGALKWEK